MNFRENMSRSLEVLSAYWRQGLRELGAALYQAGTAAQHPEYGMAGTKTPGEVADGVRAKEHRSTSRDDGPAPGQTVQPSVLKRIWSSRRTEASRTRSAIGRITRWSVSDANRTPRRASSVTTSCKTAVHNSMRRNPPSRRMIFRTGSRRNLSHKRRKSGNLATKNFSRPKTQLQFSSV
jgi:hypothetical protein